MKQIRLIIIAAATLVFAASCAKEAPAPAEGVQTGAPVSFTATLDPASKTILVTGNKVEWLSGDAISVFDGNTNVAATTNDSGATATFSQSLSSPGPWYALYPYWANASQSGSVITTNLPAQQTAVAGSFADDLNIAVALSDNGHLAFKNVLGLIKFTIGADADIVKVTLSGNNGEIIAGTVSIDYNGGVPSWSLDSDGATSIEMTGTFVQGSTYYFAVLPQTFSNGISLVYTNSSDNERTESSPNELVLGRSKIRNIGSPDIIQFADPDVKAAIVAHFDTNSDGELSKAEAEAVTYNDFEALVGSTGETVNNLWGDDLSKINSFDEMKYFTGLVNTAQSNRLQFPPIFRGCSSLTSVKIPSNITHISNYCFTGCSALASIEFPAGLQYIYTHCFENCSSLTSISLPPTLKQISSYGFSGCSSIQSVNGFGSTILTIINIGTFSGCSSLTSIDIPNSVTEISHSVFLNCAALASVNWVGGSTITLLNSNTFKGCTSLTSIAIPNTVTELKTSVFEGCTNLETVTGFTGVLKIGASSFKDCTKLGALPFNSTVLAQITTIGNYAFQNCMNMTMAVKNCTALTSLGKAAFMNCKKLTIITLRNSAFKTLQDSTFLGCTALTGVRVSNNLTTVRGYAFYGCSSLTTFSNTGESNGFILPTKVTDIYSYAFSGCPLLGSTNSTPGVPDFMTNDEPVLKTIGNRAFRYCSSFTKVELPSSVTTFTRPFGTAAAKDKDSHPDWVMNLTELKLNSVAPPEPGSNPIFENWTDDMLSSLEIKVPSSSLETYKAATGWATYKNYMIGF